MGSAQRPQATTPTCSCSLPAARPCLNGMLCCTSYNPQHPLPSSPPAAARCSGPQASWPWSGTATGRTGPGCKTQLQDQGSRCKEHRSGNRCVAFGVVQWLEGLALAACEGSMWLAKSTSRSSDLAHASTASARQLSSPFTALHGTHLRATATSSSQASRSRSAFCRSGRGRQPVHTKHQLGTARHPLDGLHAKRPQSGLCNLARSTRGCSRRTAHKHGCRGCTTPAITGAQPAAETEAHLSLLPAAPQLLFKLVSLPVDVCTHDGNSSSQHKFGCLPADICTHETHRPASTT